MARASRLLAAAACLSMLASGCTSADGTISSLPGGGPVKAPTIRFPSQLVGLEVVPEDVSKVVAAVKRPYVDSLTVFSFREKELLRATLQLSRFNRLARPNDAKFRASIIGLLGSSRPLLIRVGETTVYVTAGNKQNVFVWFTDDGLFVLSVTLDYAFPKTLLRRVIEQDVQL